MKKGFVLLLALVFALTAFAYGNGSYDYNDYDGSTGHNSEGLNSGGEDYVTTDNTAVFNYLSNTVFLGDYQISVSLAVNMPAGTNMIVIFKNVRFVNYDDTGWYEFKRCYIAIASSVGNSGGINDTTDVADYGDSVEYRAAFYNAQGKLLGISNTITEAWEPII